MAYGWCAVIWENRRRWKDREILLFLLLGAGFRRRPSPFPINLIHTEHHQELAEAVFKSNSSKAIADLLRAMTMCRCDEFPL